MQEKLSKNLTSIRREEDGENIDNLIHVSIGVSSHRLEFVRLISRRSKDKNKLLLIIKYIALCFPHSRRRPQKEWSGTLRKPDRILGWFPCSA